MSNSYPSKHQALKNAVEKGYITKQDMIAQLNKPKKPKRKKINRPKPRIFYGLNTNSM